MRNPMMPSLRGYQSVLATDMGYNNEIPTAVTYVNGQRKDVGVQHICNAHSNFLRERQPDAMRSSSRRIGCICEGLEARQALGHINSALGSHTTPNTGFNVWVVAQ
jgi:hypothetical protein